MNIEKKWQQEYRMNSYLEGCIKKAYPKGLKHELDEGLVENDVRDKRLSGLIVIFEAMNLDSKVTLWSDLKYIEIVITQKDHPTFSEFVSKMTNLEKIDWIKRNESPYPVFWLKISRIADYYYYFYNHWIPRGDTGYLDADFRISPNHKWLEYETKIKNMLEEQGFINLTTEIGSESTPFVLEYDYDSIPEDDPRWDEEDFFPPLVPSTVFNCLFGG